MPQGVLSASSSCYYSCTAPSIGRHELFSTGANDTRKLNTVSVRAPSAADRRHPRVLPSALDDALRGG